MTASAAMTPITLFENLFAGFLEKGRRGPTLVTQPVPCTPAATVVVAGGKVETVADKRADVGDSTGEAL